MSTERTINSREFEAYLALSKKSRGELNCMFHRDFPENIFMVSEFREGMYPPQCREENSSLERAQGFLNFIASMADHEVYLHRLEKMLGVAHD